MKYRQIPGTSLKVSVLGCGCGRVSLSPQYMRLLNEAADVGINLFDTASSYSMGLSEIVLGNFLSSRRNERERFVVITKAGREPRAFRKIFRFVLEKASRDKFQGLIKWMRSTEMRQNFDRGYILKTIESSLRRLRTDYVDIFLLHSPPIHIWGSDKWEELLEVFDLLKRQGKIRYYGFSVPSVDLLVEYAWPSSVSTVAAVVNVLQESQRQYIKSLDKAGVHLIVYQPFGSGTLFHAPKSLINVLQNEIRHSFPQDFSTAQLVLATLLAQTNVVSVVIGMSKHEHLLENVKVTEVLGGNNVF